MAARDGQRLRGSVALWPWTAGWWKIKQWHLPERSEPLGTQRPPAAGQQGAALCPLLNAETWLTCFKDLTISPLCACPAGQGSCVSGLSVPWSFLADHTAKSPAPEPPHISVYRVPQPSLYGQLVPGGQTWCGLGSDPAEQARGLGKEGTDTGMQGPPVCAGPWKGF